MSLKRTDSGLLAKYRLFREPVVWVEGQTDVSFYREILKSIPCRIEVANGKTECRKLADAISTNDRPYVVVMDGDYDILLRKRSSHRRIILLQRHSVENYLFEKNAVQRVCGAYMPADDDDARRLPGERFDSAKMEIESKMRDLIVLDVAHCLSNSGSSAALSAYRLITNPVGTDLFSEEKIELAIGTCALPDVEHIARARRLVNEFTDSRSLADLINGHFLLEVIRILVEAIVNETGSRRPHVDNSGLRHMLTVEAWTLPLGDDHRNLKRRLRSAVRDAARLRQWERRNVSTNDTG